MNIHEIKNIINRQVTKRGYRLEERPSTSSNSWYFKIYSSDTDMLFRVSDHKTKSNIVTLRFDKCTSPKNVESFVNNRCQDLSDRRLKKLLGV